MATIIISANREAYGKDEVKTMTVAEIIEALQEFDPEDRVILSHDGGYTYGGFHKCHYDYEYDDEEEE